MSTKHIIKRSPYLSIYFIALLGLLWFKMFGDKPLLQEPTYLIFATLVAVFFLTVPVLYLAEKIIVQENAFTYKTLFSGKSVVYKRIASISFQTSKQHDIDDERTQHFHTAVIKLQNGKRLNIPFVFFVGEERGTILVRQAVAANPDIQLDDRMSQIRDGEPIPGITASRMITFLFANAMILFVFSVIP